MLDSGWFECIMSSLKPTVDGITMASNKTGRACSPNANSFCTRGSLQDVSSPLHYRGRPGWQQGEIVSWGSLKKLVNDMQMSRDIQSSDNCETSNEGSCSEADSDKLTGGFKFNSKWVVASLTQESLSWEVPSKKNKNSTGYMAGCIPMNEIIAVEHVKAEESRFRWLCLKQAQVHKLVIHTFTRKKRNPCEWVPCKIEFQSPDGSAVSNWASALKSLIASFSERPKRLWVFINPFGGRRQANKIWKYQVLPIFQLAGINYNVTITTCRNHAYDAVSNSSSETLMSFDGIIAVGGDGFFQEIMNAVLDHNSKSWIDQNTVLKKLRIGHIPAGSTDAVSWSLHGTPCTTSAALRVAIGDRLSLDVMKLHTNASEQRYSACLAGYGFMGDIISTSENLRWLGPVRYDIAGLLAFLAGRSHRARILYKPTVGSPPVMHSTCNSGCPWCKVSRMSGFGGSLATGVKEYAKLGMDESQDVEPFVELKGDFLSIMVTVTPCRSGQALKGVTPYAHLGDGRIHLVLVRKTSRINMLRWLVSLSKHGVQPGKFSFVETVDAAAIRIEPLDGTSSWNVDGELVIDQDLTAIPQGGMLQVFSRGIERAWTDRGE